MQHIRCIMYLSIWPHLCASPSSYRSLMHASGPPTTTFVLTCQYQQLRIYNTTTAHLHASPSSYHRIMRASGPQPHNNLSNKAYYT
jgi:hypothetical protein